LALVATEPGTTGRTLGLAAALGTGLARMYVGAHMPLDIIGGLAIGTISGVTVRRVNCRSR
jgi:undecaprenyl-diphosphatase